MQHNLQYCLQFPTPEYTSTRKARGNTEINTKKIFFNWHVILDSEIYVLYMPYAMALNVNVKGKYCRIV